MVSGPPSEHCPCCRCNETGPLPVLPPFPTGHGAPQLSPVPIFVRPFPLRPLLVVSGALVARQLQTALTNQLPAPAPLPRNPTANNNRRSD